MTPDQVFNTVDAPVGGWVYNATTGTTTGPVDWGTFPPLLTTELGHQLYEVQFWSHVIQRWVAVVARRTGRAIPGLVEVEADAVYSALYSLSTGVTIDAVIANLVGDQLGLSA